MRLLFLSVLAVLLGCAMAGSMARAKSVLGGPLKVCYARAVPDGLVVPLEDPAS